MTRQKRSKCTTVASRKNLQGIAVDPGKRSGWATWFEGVITDCGVVDGDDLESILTLLNCGEPGVLLVETQYLKMSWNGLQTLMGRRFAWEVLGRWRGYSVERVAPVDWQRHFGLARGGDRAEHKEQLRRFASAASGRELDCDACDAWLIARYWLDTRGSKCLQVG